MDNRQAILLIEDEVELAEQLAEYLDFKGYRVLQSRTSIDAINKCMNQRFDCILTDINLEKGTGDTVILNVKQSFGNPNYSTPIIVISSALNPGLLERVKNFIDWAFVKPYSIEALLNKMQEVMKKPAKIHK